MPRLLVCVSGSDSGECGSHNGHGVATGRAHGEGGWNEVLCSEVEATHKGGACQATLAACVGEGSCGDIPSLSPEGLPVGLEVCSMGGDDDVEGWLGW